MQQVIFNLLINTIEAMSEMSEDPRELGEDVMSERDAIVFVVDDDSPMRESLKNLIRSVGLRAARPQSKYTAIGIPNLAETAAG